jgi:putative flavoprotein involved in K+ transport
MPPTECEVVIVGAGASGLAAGAAVKKLGHEPVLFERDPRVGERWANRYERLHLHTVRHFSGLPEHGVPRECGRYVSKDAFAEYLRSYAERFSLDVRLGADVRGLRPVDGHWLLETGSDAYRARAAVVATGRYNEPVMPDWPGAGGFRGRLLHAVAYRTGSAFVGARVLVVGPGTRAPRSPPISSSRGPPGSPLRCARRRRS